MLGQILLLLQSTPGFDPKACSVVGDVAKWIRRHCTFMRNGRKMDGANLMDVRRRRANRSRSLSPVERGHVTRIAPYDNQAANNLLVLSVVERDEALMKTCVKEIRATVTIGHAIGDSGVQADGSFHQHGPQQMVLSYGVVQSKIAVKYAALLHGTPWSFRPAEFDTLATQILDGQQWFVFGEQRDFHAEGRGAFRGENGAHVNNARSLSHTLRTMARIDTRPERREAYLAFAERCVGKKDATSSGPFGTRVFYRSDTLCTRSTRGWYFSCRFHSSRVVPTECNTNRENLLGYHLADGAHFLLRPNSCAYHDVQPVWNFRRLPGITSIDLNENVPMPYGSKTGSSSGRSMCAFVGGATDGEVGAACMVYKRAGLRMKKAVFVCPRLGAICCGAGITLDPATRSQAVPTTSSRRRVLTTLCQRRVDPTSTNLGDVRVMKKTSKGTTMFKSIDKTEYHCSAACHDGVACVLLDNEQTTNGTMLNVTVESRVGSWSRVEEKASSDRVEKKMWRAWIDHGDLNDNVIDRDGVSYAYALLPYDSDAIGSEMTTFLKTSRERTVKVLANDVYLQAVRIPNATLAIFHAGRVVARGGHIAFEASDPCAVTVRHVKDSEYVLSVADPSQRLASVQLRLTGAFDTAKSKERVSREVEKDMDTGLTHTRLSIAMESGVHAGRSVVLGLRRL